MTPQDYKRLTLAQMQARRWRTANPIQTRVGRIEAGQEVTICFKRSGLDISSAVCPHCGVSFYARGCHPSSLEEIP